MSVLTDLATVVAAEEGCLRSVVVELAMHMAHGAQDVLPEVEVDRTVSLYDQQDLAEVLEMAGKYHGVSDADAVDAALAAIAATRLGVARLAASHTLECRDMLIQAREECRR